MGEKPGIEMEKRVMKELKEEKREKPTVERKGWEEGARKEGSAPGWGHWD